VGKATPQAARAHHWRQCARTGGHDARTIMPHNVARGASLPTLQRHHAWRYHLLLAANFIKIIKLIWPVQSFCKK